MVYPAKTNPEAIRAVAIDVLEREGDEALTLRRLARELGLAPNALYRHYASREVLMAAVADEVARRLVAAVGAELAAREAAARPGGLDARGRVSILAEVYAAFGTTHPALYKALMGRRGDAEATLPRPLGYDVLWDLVTREVEALTGRDKAPIVAVALWGLLHGLWALQHADLLGGDRPSAPTAFAIETLLRGLA
jgi:AcrR family transcriptional regulator